MNPRLRRFYPVGFALALALSLLLDGTLFIMTLAAAIAALPLAYAADVDEIARRVRAEAERRPGDDEPPPRGE